MAEAWGVPNYKFITIPHPIANLNEQELEQRAREVVTKVVQLLLEGKNRVEGPYARLETVDYITDRMWEKDYSLGDILL